MSSIKPPAATGKRPGLGVRLLSAINRSDDADVVRILSAKSLNGAKIKALLTTEIQTSDSIDVPLMAASRSSNPAIVKYMVDDHQADINYVHEYSVQGQIRRKTPLIVSVRQGAHATVGTILSLTADPAYLDHNGRTALHHAVRRADCRMARLLLSHGARPTVADHSAETPLHVAARLGHVELVLLLARHGADLYRRDKDGAPVIHVAAKHGHASLVRTLVTTLEVEADLRVTCYDGKAKAPIHVAAAESHSDTVHTLLLWCSANVQLTDSVGDTALHYAVSRRTDPLGNGSVDGQTVAETVRVLLGFSAPVCGRNQRGETALHVAASNRLAKAIDVMLSAGCDPLIKDNSGKLPLDLASNNDQTTKQLLQAAMNGRESASGGRLPSAESSRSLFTGSAQRRLLPTLSALKCIQSNGFSYVKNPPPVVGSADGVGDMATVLRRAQRTIEHPPDHQSVNASSTVTTLFASTSPQPQPTVASTTPSRRSGTNPWRPNTVADDPDPSSSSISCATRRYRRQKQQEVTERLAKRPGQNGGGKIASSRTTAGRVDGGKPVKVPAAGSKAVAKCPEPTADQQALAAKAPSKDNRKYSPLALRRNRSSTSKQSSTSVSLASSSAGSRLQTPPRSGSRSNIKGHSSSIRCSDSQESALSETSSVSSLSRASKRRRKHWAELLSMLSCSSILPGVLSTSSTSRPAYLADDLFSQAALSWKPTAACAADSGGGCEGTGVGRCSMVGRKRSSSTVVNATCSRNLSTLTSAVKQLKSAYSKTNVVGTETSLTIRPSSAVPNGSVSKSTTTLHKTTPKRFSMSAGMPRKSTSRFSTSASYIKLPMSENSDPGSPDGVTSPETPISPRTGAKRSAVFHTSTTARKQQPEMVCRQKTVVIRSAKVVASSNNSKRTVKLSPRTCGGAMSRSTSRRRVDRCKTSRW